MKVTSVLVEKNENRKEEGSLSKHDHHNHNHPMVDVIGEDGLFAVR